MSEKELLQKSFQCIDKGVDCLFVAPYYLGKLREILPKDILLACPVDYPSGLGDTKLRQHGCISAINKGADFIDLVINPVHVINQDKKFLTDDIKSNKSICHGKADLRVILDYRMFTDGLVFYTASILKNLGIEFIIPSTGQFVEDFLDNLIVCQLIMNKNPGVKTILNTLALSEEQSQKLAASSIYGVRIKSF